jgi:hypothetical protein
VKLDDLIDGPLDQFFTLRDEEGQVGVGWGERGEGAGEGRWLEGITWVEVTMVGVASCRLSARSEFRHCKRCPIPQRPQTPIPTRNP